jgi:hypothetical protein
MVKSEELIGTTEKPTLQDELLHQRMSLLSGSTVYNC